MQLSHESSKAACGPVNSNRSVAAHKPRLARPTALVLCPEMPFPPNGGSALRSASIITYLAARYDVDLVVFGEAGSEGLAQESIPVALRRIEHVRFAERPAGRWGKVLHAGWQMISEGVTPMMARFGGLEAQLEKILAGRKYDLAIIEQTWLAPYFHQIAAVAGRVILDLHNIDSELFSRAAQSGSWHRRGFHLFSAVAWRRLERRWLPRYDELLMTSEPDAAGVRRLTGRDTARVFPNTVPWYPLPNRLREEALIFTGTLLYGPNREAMRWFYDFIWPQVRAQSPGLRWRIMGRHPEAVPEALRSDERIEILGAVPEAMPVLAAAKIAIVPLLSGSGTRLKILEAWAAGTPVISTSLGAEGLAAVDGLHLLIADTPAEFAAAIDRLLREPELGASLSRAGRTLYEEQFTWEAGWKHLRALGL